MYKLLPIYKFELGRYLGIERKFIKCTNTVDLKVVLWEVFLKYGPYSGPLVKGEWYHFQRQCDVRNIHLVSGDWIWTHKLSILSLLLYQNSGANIGMLRLIYVPYESFLLSSSKNWNDLVCTFKKWTLIGQRDRFCGFPDQQIESTKLIIRGLSHTDFQRKFYAMLNF